MKWIKASERLPDVGKLVFVIAQKTYRLICQLSINDNFHEWPLGNVDIRDKWDPKEIEWLEESQSLSTETGQQGEMWHPNYYPKADRLLIEIIEKEKSACQATINHAGENKSMIYAMNNQIAAFDICLKHLKKEHPKMDEYAASLLKENEELRAEMSARNGYYENKIEMLTRINSESSNEAKDREIAELKRQLEKYETNRYDKDDDDYDPDKDRDAPENNQTFGGKY